MRNPRPHARKQGRADLVLQSLDVMSLQRTLRQPQFRDGFGEASRFHNGSKHIELVQVHLNSADGSSVITARQPIYGMDGRVRNPVFDSAERRV